MANSRGKKQKKAAPLPKVGEGKWTLRTKLAWIAFVTVAGALGALGLQGPDAIDGLMKLPPKATEAWHKFLGWKGDDAGWTGIWSNDIEGYVNNVDLAISNVEMRVDLAADKGMLDGMFATRELCKQIPLFNFVLVRGSSAFDSADAEIYDFIGGKERLFARVTLKRDGPVLVIQATEDRLGWFKGPVRLARAVGSDTATQDKARDSFCETERNEWVKKHLSPSKQ